MNSIAVFAHYDNDGIIDDYVIHYLNELKTIADKIIFVSDCEIEQVELDKIRELADFVLAKKHGEYDFGSYKRGYLIAKENGLFNEAENLIFANDSCYGPFGSLSKVFEELNNKACDFWGITLNENCLEGKDYPCTESNNKHLQSYFLVFKKQVFMSEVFEDFINSIKKEENKIDIIINYEFGITKQLCKAGFRYEAMYPDHIGECNRDDLFCIEKSPFLFFKTSLLKDVYFIWIFSPWLKKIENTYNYPIQNVVTNLIRIRNVHNFKPKYIRKGTKYRLRKLMKAL